MYKYYITIGITALLIVCGVLQLMAKRPATGNMVLFGENTTRMSPPDSNTIRVFMDKNGDYYPPETFINDKALYKAGGTLRDWYVQYPDSFSVICNKFSVPASDVVSDRVAMLNNAICKHYAGIINGQRQKQLFMLVHGFRKRAYTKPDLFTLLATTDNDALKKTLSKMMPEKSNLYLEIYWDACYFRPSKALKAEGFIIFRDQAVPNANKVGQSLRQLVAMLDAGTLNIVSHSLGARVACNLLYNVTPDAAVYPTPATKKIRACFIAPAVGHDIFENFYQRSGAVPGTDNYEVSIVYNRYDHILRKEGRFLGITFINHTALGFVNTSLGCDYKGDIKKLQELFSKNFSSTRTPLVIDVTHRRRVTNHLVPKYCKSPRFRELRVFWGE